jgi:hypothetical protein
LPTVTLACVDTRLPMLALQAMRRCLDQIEFARAVLLTDPAVVAAPPPEAAGIELVPITIDSVPAYSEFMLRGLAAHVHTDHVLIVQWDGYVLDAAQWDPAFLDQDYIGAPLRGEPPQRAVGNGGFTLRSRRLLLAMQDPEMVVRHPEDVCICHDNRERLERVHGLRFAPLELASRFAYERVEPAGPTFGFHGLFNLHRVLPADELHRLLCELPDGMARGLDAHDLCRSLIQAGRLDSAAVILAKRRRLGMRDRRSWRLRLQWAWRRWVGSNAS